MIDRHVCVCIASHRRPEGLMRLLRSLVDQNSPPPFEVIVVDNDHERSAEQVVCQFRDRISIEYLVEPIRGIARARNRAVALAKSPFLAFIDDDEVASAKWLAAMDRTAIASRADVVIGPVSVVFEGTLPDFVRTCSLFQSILPAEGAIVPWYATRASNAYVRRQSLPDLLAPFSTRFDLMGGEDVDLFKRMCDAGARIVASQEGTVCEYRPRKRANLRWIMRRALRNGGTIAAVGWERVGTAQHAFRTLRSGLTGVGEAAEAIVRWDGDRELATHHLIRACEEMGKVLYTVGLKIEEYRNHP